MGEHILGCQDTNKAIGALLKYSTRNHAQTDPENEIIRFIKILNTPKTGVYLLVRTGGTWWLSYMNEQLVVVAD